MAQTPLQQATELTKSDRKAEGILKEILALKNENDEATRDQEAALMQLAQLYRDEGNAEGLADVVRLSRQFMSSTAKAKSAKLVRTLIDYFGPLPSSTAIQTSLLNELIAWARGESRIFLAQSLEIRLATLFLETRQYRDGLAIVDRLLGELRRLDDKMILTEVHLLESKLHHATQNLPKAKAALTSSRTAANSIYCPPHLQAQLDMQSGLLLAEDKDYKTAYSYFFEAFEGMGGVEDAPGALAALKYMLLCKIMLNAPEDVNTIMNVKLASKHAGRQVDAMKAIAAAHQARNLAAFEQALKDYQSELQSDPTIRTHLSSLYDTLLEQNLLKIIEPFSRVEISHVAELVGQPVSQVELKLSQMILDKVFNGILDQGAGCLVVYDEPEEDETYSSTLDTLKHIGHVVESLYGKATKLA
ncbi:PCI-domain-containing protein [Dacryopinax primogenitus]|uniref:PCI-domain-containing protein n=1 Tax=Dacryopinax primogenitus (strain DJM 731) TaxID=1858805 RepID=M5G9Z5_DACPD|nr:PCI-domain-containing protein [Dacryopinax primogenitus]EJU05145.1 PCI-domain-containing protein [Dacryopinax primogenitus]